MRCYLSHPNSIGEDTLAQAVALLQTEGWEVVDPTSFGKDMATVKPWEWDYDRAFLLTKGETVIGRGSFQDVVNFAGRGVPMEHLPSRKVVVAVRKVGAGGTWKKYGSVVLAGPGEQVCPACLGTGEATGFTLGLCQVCAGHGVVAVTLPATDVV